MLRRQDLLDMAEACRDMSMKARALKLRLEFAERADKYEMVAAILTQRQAPTHGG